MKAYLYYCEKSSLNDATNYYVGIIERALYNKKVTLVKTMSLDSIVDADIIVTITVKAFFKAKCRNRKAKTIFWSQGVSAEEAIMSDKTLYNYYRFVCRFLLSFIALHLANVIFLVSEEMRKHYKHTYLCRLDDAIIMPCYNLPPSTYFELEQYNAPTFVYAGNAAAWQGVDLMLDVYALVEREITNASLMLLSKNEKEFKEKISARGIKNYEIKYVNMSNLQDELHKYKYGFILRDNHIVNRVATPTKMNSYLSNYLIPIFSNTVDDFNRHIELGEYTIKAQYPLDAKVIAQQIIEFENTPKDFRKYKTYVDSIFENHYNDEVYLNIIDYKIKNWF